MADILDSVRVNTRQQKLHVRTIRPQQSPVALLIWHHGEQAACFRVASKHTRYSTRLNCMLQGTVSIC